jgi:hypothetical protein
MENLIDFSGHSTADEVSRFCFGGHAFFMLESRVSGRRYTFEISREEIGQKEFLFATVMTDRGQHAYIGLIESRRDIKLTTNSMLAADATEVKALGWFLRNLAAGRIPDSVVVYCLARRGCRGRDLTGCGL